MVSSPESSLLTKVTKAVRSRLVRKKEKEDGDHKEKREVIIREAKTENRKGREGETYGSHSLEK